MPAPTAPNHRWSMDLVHDQLVEGRCFRLLKIIDDFTRETDKVIRQGNGSKLTSKAMQAWAARHDMRLNVSGPEKPTQNAFIESFNGRMRGEFLNQTLLFRLQDARFGAEQWRITYNTMRPNNSIGCITPA